jgi:hypothetical protein
LSSLDAAGKERPSSQPTQEREMDVLMLVYGLLMFACAAVAARAILDH